jgi:hypothetical protein
MLYCQQRGLPGAALLRSNMISNRGKCRRSFDRPERLPDQERPRRAMHASRITREAGQDSCGREEEVSHFQPSKEGRLPHYNSLAPDSFRSQPAYPTNRRDPPPRMAIFAAARYFAV